MSDIRSHEVLLALSMNSYPIGQAGIDANRSLTDIMATFACPEVHLLHIHEFRTPTFQWPLMVEFRLSDPLVRDDLRAAVSDRCRWLGDGVRFLPLTQTRFGDEQDGADLIVSLYSWQAATTPAERTKNMWLHFGMEREETSYSSVHFNTASGERTGIDFVFQAYVNDPEGLSRVYSSPRLEVMREHSRTFLDTDTRQLAFGKVQIIR